MSDAERAEQLRKQLLRFLPATVLGVVLGLGGYGSWSYFEEANTRHSIEASGAFTEFVEGDWIERDFAEIEPEELGEIVDKGEELLKAYPEHFYADLSRFILARLLVQRRDYDVAIGHLRIVVGNRPDDYSVALAHYRLAQLHQLKSEDSKALEYLDKIKIEDLKPVADDLRGDIHLRAYNYEEAWKSWTRAHEATEIDSLKSYIKTKIDFIESIPPETAEEIIRKGLADYAKAKAEREAKEAEEAKKAEEAEQAAGSEESPKAEEPKAAEAINSPEEEKRAAEILEDERVQKAIKAEEKKSQSVGGAEDAKNSAGE